MYSAQEGGASEEQQAKIRALCVHIFQTVATTGDDVAAGARIGALIDAAVAARVINSERAAAIRQLLTPGFVRQELNDAPVKYLKKVRVPVLALVGTLDRIVPAGPYVEVMRPAVAAKPEVTKLRGVAAVSVRNDSVECRNDNGHGVWINTGSARPAGQAVVW